MIVQVLPQRCQTGGGCRLMAVVVGVEQLRRFVGRRVCYLLLLFVT